MNKENKIRNEEVGGSRKTAGASSIAVGFSQRLKAANSSFGLQPHVLKMWIKPLVRQLPACRTGRKQTAIGLVPNPVRGRNMTLAAIHGMTASHTVKNERYLSGNRQLGLPADMFFNN